jgi:hypothetical protein
MNRLLRAGWTTSVYKFIVTVSPMATAAPRYPPTGCAVAIDAKKRPMTGGVVGLGRVMAAGVFF